MYCSFLMNINALSQKKKEETFNMFEANQEEDTILLFIFVTLSAVEM